MDAARTELSMTRTAFIAYTLASALKRWKSPVTNQTPVAAWPSGWPKNAVCYRCKELGHDPLEQHGTVGSYIPSYEWDDVPKFVALAKKKAGHD